jgi:glutathione synthase/RimK-type ligase-like ATP-grasp enzyme
MKNKIYIIHENDEWIEPLRKELQDINAPFEEWHLGKRNIDHLDKPPQGIFYNRMSASSHTRGHRYAPEYTAVVLNWLEKNKRRVINNSRALSLEISKSLQYKELESFEIKTPKTIYCHTKESIIKSGRLFTKPFITKHNRAGKGLGVKLFNNKKELDSYVSSKDFEPSIDGITLLQEYIDAKPKVITRVEFINSKFIYAVEVDASDGFELCPACPDEPTDVPETQFFGEYCPTIGNKFRIIKNFKKNEIIKKYEKFIKANGIEIAGIEYIEDKDGIIYTYDVNTNTNYNSQAEKSSKIKGMKSIAEFLKKELLSLSNIKVVA